MAQNPPQNPPPTPYVGVWKGTIKEGKMVTITLETTSQSRNPVGWYSIYEKFDMEKSGCLREKTYMFEHIDYDVDKGVISLHAHYGAEEIILTMWVSPTTMIGLQGETTVVLMRM